MIKNNTLFSYVLFLLMVVCACSKEKEAVQAPVKNSWQQKHPEVLLAFDAQKNLYQLKVLQQKTNECSLHQERNLLFAMSMFRDEDNFINEYRRMMNEKLLDEMTFNTPCWLRRPDGSFAPTGKAGLKEQNTRMKPDIKKMLNNTPGYAQFLPEKTPEDLEKIIRFDRVMNNSGVRKDLEFYRVTIPKIESIDALPRYFAEDAVRLASPGGGLETYKFLKHSGNEPKLMVPIALGLNATVIRHAVSLLLRKVDNQFEYIFMDPENWNMIETQNYMDVLNTIIRITSDLKYFKESLIRSAYINIFHSLSEPSDIASNEYYSKPENRAEHIYYYWQIIDQMDVVKDEFFLKFYKGKTCELINKYIPNKSITLRIDIGATRSEIRDARSELQRRFNCPIE